MYHHQYSIDTQRPPVQNIIQLEAMHCGKHCQWPSMTTCTKYSIGSNALWEALSVTLNDHLYKIFNWKQCIVGSIVSFLATICSTYLYIVLAICFPYKYPNHSPKPVSCKCFIIISYLPPFSIPSSFLRSEVILVSDWNAAVSLLEGSQAFQWR